MPMENKEDQNTPVLIVVRHPDGIEMIADKLDANEAFEVVIHLIVDIAGATQCKFNDIMLDIAHKHSMDERVKAICAECEKGCDRE